MMVRDPNTLIVGNHDLPSPTPPIIPSTVQPQKQIPSSNENIHAFMAMKMEIYAAQVDRMDQGIGSILAALEKHGIGDNTMVVFLSDIGGPKSFDSYGED